jgi:type II secretion system protein N
MMQLPRLTLPMPRLSFEWLGVLGNRRMWLYIGYTTLLFLVFLVATFPHEVLVRRVMSMAGSGPRALQFNGARFAWHKGFEISGVKFPGIGDGDTPLLELSHVWVRPLFSALVRGNPYALNLDADLYGGGATAQIDLSNGRFVGTVQLEAIDLGRFRTLTALLQEGQLGGHLSGQLDFEGRTASLESAQASGELVLDRAAIADAKINGITVPDLSLSQTRTKFSIRSSRLEIQEFVANGDVSIQGSGQIVLRTPLQDSALNLRATILPTPSTPDAVRALIGLIPRPSGSKPDAPMTITGTLMQPRVR